MEKGIIEVINHQSLYNEGEEDEIKLFTVGEYEYTPEKTTLKYIENMGSNAENKTEAILIFENSEAVLMRSGEFNSMMVFKEGHEYRNDYNTPYGVLDFNVLAKRIECNFSEEEGSAEIEYILSGEGMPDISNCIMIKYKKDSQNEN